MRKKLHYHICAGSNGRSSKAYTYSYGHIKNITIHISQKGFSIDYDQAAKKDQSDFLNDLLIRDAIKKIEKIQLIQYGRMIGLDKLNVQIDNVNVFQYRKEEGGEILYSLCGKKLDNKLKGSWNEHSYQRILNTNKSKGNSLDATLDAFLIAKSKTYESEKFMYLWMSMNGMYNYIAETAACFCNKTYTKEYEKLNLYGNFQKCGRYPFKPNNDDQARQLRIIRKLDSLLKNIDENNYIEIIAAIKNNDTKSHIESEIEEMISALPESGKVKPYGLLLLNVPYFIRCKYFHGDKPLPLFSFENEYPLTILKLLNYLIEDHIDEQLPSFLNENNFENAIKPRIQELVTKQ